MAAKRKPRPKGTIRSLPSGNYRAVIRRTINGQVVERSETFGTKSAAQFWLERMSKAQDWDFDPNPENGQGRVPTLREYSEKFLKSRGLSERTVYDYGQMLEAHILPVFGDRPVDAIRVADVVAWHSDLLTNSPTSRARTYALLRAVLNSAYQSDLIQSNPCRIRGAGSSPRRPVTAVPEPGAIARLANEMPSENYRLMVLVAAWCGLRFGELTELRAKDVTSDSIEVRRAVTRVDDVYVVKQPKSSAGFRVVPMPEQVRTDLLAWVEGKHAEELLFPGRDGQHMRQSSLAKVFYPARERAGLPDLRWHDLRHYTGTTATMVGASLRDVQRLLGHSTVEAAMRYQGYVESRGRGIADAFSALASPVEQAMEGAEQDEEQAG